MRAVLKYPAIAALVAAFLCLPGKGQTQGAVQRSVITFYYPTGSVTYSGEWPYWGSAGASWNIPLGTLVRLPDGRVVTITDRGLLGYSNWIDVHCPWEMAAYCQATYDYGPYDIEILRWGW